MKPVFFKILQIIDNVDRPGEEAEEAKGLKGIEKERFVEQVLRKEQRSK
jgi:hypothetical protein